MTNIKWFYTNETVPPTTDIYLITVIDPYDNDRIYTYMDLYYQGSWSQYTDEEVLAWSFLPEPAEREV